MIKESYYSQKIIRIQFVCSVLIVILHSNNINGYNLVADGSLAGNLVLGIEEFISVLGHCAVPTFFSISAYLFFRQFSMSTYKSKILKRVKTLLVPYLVWNIIGVLFFAVLTNLPFIAKYMNQSAVKLTPVDLVLSVILSSYTPLWYVRNLMVYFILAPVIFVLIRRKKIGVILIVSCVIINLLTCSTYYSLQNWLPMVMFGGWIAVHYNELIISSNPNTFKKWSGYVIILYAILYLLTFLSGSSERIIYLYRCVSSLAIWVSFDYLYPPVTIKWWQKISFFIYCSHLFIVSIFQKITLLMFGKSWGIAFGVYCITPPVILLIVFFVALFMQKRLPKLWSIMNGGRC